MQRCGLLSGDLFMTTVLFSEDRGHLEGISAHDSETRCVSRGYKPLISRRESIINLATNQSLFLSLTHSTFILQFSVSIRHSLIHSIIMSDCESEIPTGSPQKILNSETEIIDNSKTKPPISDDFNGLKLYSLEL